MPWISEFDPWKSSMCTCPRKMTLNPYTGCDHGCLYCYASSYVPNFQNCRPKKKQIRKLEREALKLKGEVISISNSSDPYPIIEASIGLTRQCLKVLTDSRCKIQIITKSNLVTRDIDLLTKVPSTVALTITTKDDDLAKIIEPQAPSSTDRLRALEDLVEKNIPVSVRIDPIIPLVNDNTQTLVSELSDIGVKHITTSTYKPKPDNWHRITKSFPTIAEKLECLYFQQGERIGSNTLLSKDVRMKILLKVRNQLLAKGMKCGVCREGLAELNTAPCDGSWLIPASTR